MGSRMERGQRLNIAVRLRKGSMPPWKQKGSNGDEQRMDTGLMELARPRCNDGWVTKKLDWNA